MKSPKRRGCAGKRRHPSRESAQEVIADIESSGAATGSMNAYRCQHCGAWHVGHRPGSNSSR